MTEETKLKLVTQMKRDIAFANVTKFFSFGAIMTLLYVSFVKNDNLLLEFLPHIFLLLAIYLTSTAYITKVVRAGIIQGISLIPEEVTED